MRLLFVPGFQEAPVQIKEIDLGDGFVEAFQDVFGGGPVVHHSREEGYEIEGIEFFERAHGVFDFALAPADKGAEHAHGFFVEVAKRSGAIAEKLRMLAKEEQLRGGIGFGAAQKVANREGEMVVSGECSGDIEDAKSIAHEPDSEVGIFRDAEARVEGTDGED